MAVVPFNQADVNLLGRLMRAEAEGEGKLGMLMVGNTGVNRVRGNGIDFTEIDKIRKMVFQNPGGFEATQKGYFYQRAREKDKRLARRTINGELVPPCHEFTLVFQSLLETVQLSGLANGIRAGSNPTASIHRLGLTVLVFINSNKE